MTWRQQVVAEAMTWVGTRYHHMGDVKAKRDAQGNITDVGGVDCAMILVRVYGDLGIIPKVDPRPYPAQWFLHRDEEKYLAWFEKYLRGRTDNPQPGDVAVYRFGKCAAHGAIIVNDDLMIHAYEPAGAVELRERRAPMVHGKLDSYWAAA